MRKRQQKVPNFTDLHNMENVVLSHMAFDPSWPTMVLKTFVARLGEHIVVFQEVMSRIHGILSFSLGRLL